MYMHSGFTLLYSRNEHQHCKATILQLKKIGQEAAEGQFKKAWVSSFDCSLFSGQRSKVDSVLINDPCSLDPRGSFTGLRWM